MGLALLFVWLLVVVITAIVILVAMALHYLTMKQLGKW